MQSNLFSNTMHDLSPEIRTLANKAELGEPRKVYHASKRYASIRLAGQIFLLWAVVWIVGSVLAVLFSSHPPSPLWILPGLLLLAGGCYMVFPQKSYACWNVSLWQTGFLYEKGPLRQVFRWDQIENIQGNAIYIPQRGYTVFTYKVRRRDGYEVKLNNVFLGIAELIDILLEEFSRHVSSPEITIVPLRSKTFTDLKMDHLGVSSKQETLSWEEMQEMTIENGRISVLKKEL